VACGNTQIFGRDYTSTFSPTASFKSILSLFHIAAVEDEVIIIVDIGNAFLESQLNSETPLIMSPPKELCHIMGWDENYLLEIKRGLYGLKQAGKLWYDLLTRILKEYGLSPSLFDPCVFSSKEKCLRVASHVDDLLICSKTVEESEKFILFLGTKLQKVKVVRDYPFVYLGITITRDLKKHTICLSQEPYAIKMLNQFPADIMPSQFPLENCNIIAEEARNNLDPINDIMGKLRYLADHTRPDILYPVNYLCRFMTNPNIEVYTELYRLIGYLKLTSHYTLTVGGTEVQLFAMSDSSFKHNDGSKAQHAYCIFLGTEAGSVSSASKRSSTVALSTTQAEADATVETIKEILWFQGFLESIFIKIVKPTIILVDNSPVVILSQDGNHLKRSKHFIIKVSYIKEQNQIGNVDVQHIQGIMNTSDILTKPLKGYLLQRHTSSILGRGLVEDQSDIST
jgi:hypothetical protein